MIDCNWIHDPGFEGHEIWVVIKRTEKRSCTMFQVMKGQLRIWVEMLQEWEEKWISWLE